MLNEKAAVAHLSACNIGAMLNQGKLTIKEAKGYIFYLQCQ